MRLVRTADRPECEHDVLAASDGFQGIAEVEYKWDASDRDSSSIERIPALGISFGWAVPVEWVTTCLLRARGHDVPDMPRQFRPRTWIAEDAFLMSVLRLLWRREPGLGALLAARARKEQYAIWSAGDPLPFLAYLQRSFQI